MLGAAVSDQCLVSLFTGTLLQNVPRLGPPAQSCWPACRGLRTRPANTWPAPARALSFASVSETPPCLLFPLPSSAHSESRDLVSAPQDRVGHAGVSSVTPAGVFMQNLFTEIPWEAWAHPPGRHPQHASTSEFWT